MGNHGLQAAVPKHTAMSKLPPTDPILDQSGPPNTLDRREWLRLTSALLACGGAGVSCGGGAATTTSAPTDTNPSGEPAPTRDPRYRTTQDALFTRVSAPYAASRLPGGEAYALDRVGPTYTLVAARVDWPWTRAGGDWLDARRVRHGESPWATTPLTAASGPAASAAYVIDVSAAVQFIQRGDRWNVLYLRCPGHPRVMSGALGRQPPRLSLVYDDGSTQDLSCHVSAAITPSSVFPSTTDPEVPLPAMLEFARPARPVRSASLSLLITQHWSGTGVAHLQVFVVDPPVNAAAVEWGVAAATPLDDGLAARPGMLGAHRIGDSTTLADIAETGLKTDDRLNYNALNAYDPALYGTGPEDRSRYPHRSLGKWIGVDDGWSVVPSTYTKEGFAPLAQGVGAIRIVREREVSEDGAVVGYATSWPVSAKIFMPPEHFGRLREIFVRYYLRLGTPDGGPYIFDPSTRYQVRTQADAALRWTDCAGKIGLMPAHDTTNGGVSGSSGGGRGWQMRMGWSDADLPAGPDVGGMGLYMHWYDFLDNVPGHNYGDASTLAPGDAGLSPFGGPGGMAYAHHWYCIETRLKLNSVDQPATLRDGSPHVVNGVRQYWTPDGELDVWIDGRKTYAKRGMVFRSLPLQLEMHRSPQLYLPPAGDLGIRDLWFNWFHGGLTRSSRSRVLFMTGVAWGTRYIGPMAITAG